VLKGLYRSESKTGADLTGNRVCLHALFLYDICVMSAVKALHYVVCAPTLNKTF
jgi:hypothetical protein